MFIHFAFRSLAREGRIDKQADSVIELVLEKKQLKACRCYEFVPVYSQPDVSGWTIDIEQTAAFNKDRLGDGNYLEIISAHSNTTRAIYLPHQVNMLCFIKTAFNKLSGSPHTAVYGKLGLVFTNTYLKSIGINQVVYYSESSVLEDPLIKKYNEISKCTNPDAQERQRLIREITYCRKPATLFPSFRESAIATIQKKEGNTFIRHWIYDDYDEGYDFTNENEWRVVVDEGEQYVKFQESDLYQVIVPNAEFKKRIETYLSQKWHVRPKVEICPG